MQVPPVTVTVFGQDLCVSIVHTSVPGHRQRILHTAEMFVKVMFKITF